MIEYNNNNLPLIERIAKFHIDFEHVHPFEDGNGRTGRVLISKVSIELAYFIKTFLDIYHFLVYSKLEFLMKCPCCISSSLWGKGNMSFVPFFIGVEK